MKSLSRSTALARDQRVSFDFFPGLYIIEFSPPRWGGGKKSKGPEMGKEIKEGKKRKKENLGKILLLTVPIHKN